MAIKLCGCGCGNEFEEFDKYGRKRYYIGKHGSIFKKGHKLNVGKKRSEETKTKISRANKGRIFSEEHRRKISIFRKGKTFEELYNEVRAKEMKIKMSLARSGKNNPRYGKHISEEIRIKMSKAKKGRKLSERNRLILKEALNRPEVKDKIRKALLGHTAWNKGKKMSEQARENMRLAQLGKKHSEETKIKIGLISKGRKSNLGKKLSEEWKQHIKESSLNNPNYGMKGKNHSKETINKISYSKIGKKYGPQKREHIEKRIDSRRAHGLFGSSNCHFWQGGKSFEPYTIEFTTYFKNKIRQRDNQVCMNCGKHREQLKKALHIHHMNYDKILTIPENCISLCHACHSLTNFNREYWTKLFQDKLSHLYGYKYEDGKIKVNLNNYLNEINKDKIEEDLKKTVNDADILAKKLAYENFKK